MHSGDTDVLLLLVHLLLLACTHFGNFKSCKDTTRTRQFGLTHPNALCSLGCCASARSRRLIKIKMMFYSSPLCMIHQHQRVIRSRVHQGHPQMEQKQSRRTFHSLTSLRKFMNSCRKTYQKAKRLLWNPWGKKTTCNLISYWENMSEGLLLVLHDFMFSSVQLAVMLPYSCLNRPQRDMYSAINYGIYGSGTTWYWMTRCEVFMLVITKAKLLSTQPNIEFEYAFMLYLLYKMTTDGEVLMEWIKTFILNHFHQRYRLLELK